MKKNTGFTLFELLVTISIIAIISCISIPNFISWRNSALVRNTAFNIKADLEQARIQAMSKRFIVRVDFYQDGYRAFYDFNENNQMEESEKIFEKKIQTASLDLSETSFGARTYARFGSRGMLTSETALGGRILIRLGPHEQQINVSRAGRIRLI